MSESSPSSSQCLSAARGSPTTLSSPITPCCIQDNVFEYVTMHEQMHEWSYTYYVYGCCSVLCDFIWVPSEVPLSVPPSNNLIHVPIKDASTESMDAIWLPIKAISPARRGYLSHFFRIHLCPEKKAQFKTVLKTYVVWHLTSVFLQPFNH